MINGSDPVPQPCARPLLNPAKPNQPVLLGDHSWEDAM